jgi:hypothetical protein
VPATFVAGRLNRPVDRQEDRRARRDRRRL